MNANDLAQKLSLNPRAVVLVGTLRERMKTSEVGQISGFAPHSTVRGCPPVQFDANGEMLPGTHEAAAIEADFTEQYQRPELAAIAGGYGRALNMVHLLFGRAGTAPNAAEAAVLREAGETFRRSLGRPTFLVAVPTLAAGSYGVAQGRLCPLGLFSDSGEAIWLHPIAVGTLLKADFPATQLHRSLTPKPPAPVIVPVVAPEPHWYEKLTAIWKAKQPRFTPAKLHETVLDRRAERLVDDGLAKTKTEGLAIAKREHAAYVAATATPAIEEAPAAPTKTRLTSARI